jgi:hypothetical protein
VYRRFVESGLAFAEVHPEKSTLLHYEELVSNPRQVLTDLLERIDEDFEASMVAEFNSSERQPGIEDPKVAATTAVLGDSVGRWRRDLEVEAARSAAHALRDVSTRLGYSVVPP